jgi:hypothetical protein
MVSFRLSPSDARQISSARNGFLFDDASDYLASPLRLRHESGVQQDALSWPVAAMVIVGSSMGLWGAIGLLVAWALR